MQTLAVPTTIWINLVILVAAAIFVRVKLGKAASSREKKPQSRTAQMARQAPSR